MATATMKKNLRMLENCFDSSHHHNGNTAKLEVITSKLVRENTKLLKENDKLNMKVKKNELCITHLLKKLEAATDLAKEQQSNFDQAIDRQTEHLAFMFRELSKSRNEIIQLKNELAFEKARNERNVEIQGIPKNRESGISTATTDISDEDTVPINNHYTAEKEKNVTALEDEIAHLRYSMLQQEAQYKESLRYNQKRIAELENSTGEQQCEREVPMMPRPIPIHSNANDDDDRMTIDNAVSQHPSRGCRGLQEEDDDAPRPPRAHGSGLRSISDTLRGGSFAKSGSRAFGIDVMRLASTRSLPDC